MTGPRETIRVPNVEVLRVTYELDSVMLPSNKRFVMSLALEVSVMKGAALLHLCFSKEMAKGNDLVAVTISYPPGRGYQEMYSSSSSSRPPSILKCQRAETIADVKSNAAFALQKQHWKEEHKDVCRLYRAMMEREEELAMKIFTFACSAEQPCKWLESLGIHQKGMWRRKCSCYSHYPYGLLPIPGGLWDSWGGLDENEYPHDSPFHNHFRDGISSSILLSGWLEYYNLRSLPLTSPVADILSHPLTVYYILTALSISSKNLLLKNKEVVLHYLGPEGELDWMTAFAEIGHLLHGMGNIQIIMVGPEVPTNLSGTTSGIGSRVRVNLVRGLYQDEANYLPAPHIIVALNCGLGNYSSWGGALDLINSMKIPAYFTNESELSCLNGKQVLRSAGLHISYPVTPNPFRSPVRIFGNSIISHHIATAFC
ncbi:hypothetical protein HAX54_020174 [Datura stramonium]|uniref:Mitochondrial splicing suppressor 51-like C-terminal domain-containing protein n=1 Tax=Datura stramonium TaxID=4076 RepID=A0ABS8S2F3_DATST|nr:hypothetical protein [Datura stramonium]